MDQKWSLVSPTRAHSLTAKFVSPGGQPMSQCIKAARMNTHTWLNLAWEQWKFSRFAQAGSLGEIHLKLRLMELVVAADWFLFQSFEGEIKHLPAITPRCLLDYTLMLLWFSLLLKRTHSQLDSLPRTSWKTNFMFGARIKKKGHSLIFPKTLFSVIHTQLEDGLTLCDSDLLVFYCK